MKLGLYLGIDGGGTKTAYLLIDESGRVVVRATGGTIDILQIGVDGYRRELESSINSLLAEAKADIRDVKGATIGIPRLGELPNMEKAMVSIPRKILSCNVNCVNDAEAGWAGALACQPGITIVAGTGSIAFGKSADGRVMRCGGWSEIFGDEGSAYWLGKKTLELFSKESDGRLPVGELLTVVRQELNLDNDFDVIGYAESHTERSEIARLQRLLHVAARRGDLNAMKAYVAAAEELATMIESIYNGLGFTGVVPVSYAGGLFHEDSILLPALMERLSTDIVELVTPKLPPEYGAALMSLIEDSNQRISEEDLSRIIDMLCDQSA